MKMIFPLFHLQQILLCYIAGSTGGGIEFSFVDKSQLYHNAIVILFSL